MLRPMVRISSGCAGLVVRPGPFDGVKVFFATMFARRDQLGETVTEWLRSNPQCEPVEFAVTQSSDAQFHCVTITVFFRERQRPS
jgi:hypothetical protein